MNQELIKAKVSLYRLILKQELKDLTNNEVDIGYLLANDKDIQNILNRSVQNGKD